MAHVKIGDISPRVQYTITAETQAGPWTYPFPIFKDANLEVAYDTAVQALATDYTVTGAGSDTGGTVTPVTLPAVGAVVTIRRTVVIQRTSDFQESGEFRAKVINDDLDTIVAILQELDDAHSRMVRLSPTSASTVDLSLPDPVAGRLLGVDAGGTGFDWKVPNGATYLAVPGVSTDTAFVRFDGAGGTAFRNSQTTEDASGNVSVAGNLSVGGTLSGYLRGDTTAVLTAGFAATPANQGTKSSGTFTPDEADGNLQYAVNGGAHTLAPPSNDGSIVIQYTNNATAGTITTSGFTKVTGTVDTTDGNDFLAYITKVNGFSHLHWQPLQ